MAISSALLAELRKRIGSDATISRAASRLIRDHGPMSPDEARWVLAHNAGIGLGKYGFTAEQLDRVRTLRASIGEAPSVSPISPAGANNTNETSKVPESGAAPTPAAIFTSRGFHEEVERTKKLFVGGHYSDAIRKAFVRVNNRVKKMAGLVSKDGQALMGAAFKDTNPPLQMTALSIVSEQDEHDGMRFMMMGAMAAMRNPRSHEDSWEPDHDPVAVLEALAYASILHRFLDRCDSYRKANP